MLFGKAKDQKRSIASTTKILTALVVLQEAGLNELVTASPTAEAVGADDPLVTELELVSGERMTVEQLLYGMLLPSANDAAVALAEHVAGSIDKFADLMEDASRKVGARDSTFTNPAGFDDPGHRSTAADLAKIARAAMRNEVFRRIVATQTYELPWPGHPNPRSLTNRNALLGAYQGADGIKTGQTRSSGKSLVASATRGSESRIAVVLSSDDPAADARALLDHGFGSFRRFHITTKGTPWGLVTLGGGETLAVVPTASAAVLIAVDSQDPAIRYESRGRVIVASIPGGEAITVPTRSTCLTKGSLCQGREGMTLFERLLLLLGPLTR